MAAQGEGVVISFREYADARAADRARRFGMAADEAGLPAPMVRRSGSATRDYPGKAELRLREMLDIIGRISFRAGGPWQAMAWYRGHHIPAFGGRTAEALVKDGKAADVCDYLDRMAADGLA